MSTLIVFTGLPGTGKSCIAEAVGRRLQIPVFAKDWLEAVLVQNGVKADEEKTLGYVGYELLTILARRQLTLGQSVILDSVVSFNRIRDQWREIADQYQAEWRVIECICSDETIFRARLEVRQRFISGWHELTWADVLNVQSYYEPWHDDRLILDAINPLDENIQAALTYLTEESS